MFQPKTVLYRYIFVLRIGTLSFTKKRMCLPVSVDQSYNKVQDNRYFVKETNFWFYNSCSILLTVRTETIDSTLNKNYKQENIKLSLNCYRLKQNRKTQFHIIFLYHFPENHFLFLKYSFFRDKFTTPTNKSTKRSNLYLISRNLRLNL